MLEKYNNYLIILIKEVGYENKNGKIIPKIGYVVLRLISYNYAKFQTVCQLGYKIIQLQSSTLIEFLWKYFGEPPYTYNGILKKK